MGVGGCYHGGAAVLQDPQECICNISTLAKPGGAIRDGGVGGHR